MKPVVASKELLEQISLSWCRRHRPESESTDWGQSLAMYGLLRSYSITKNEEVKEYLWRWLRFHLAEGIHPHYFCGSWSFALLYPEVAKIFPEAKLQLDVTAEKIYEVITKKALRNGDGVILHNIDLPNIYIDTVYYTSVLLAKLGSYLGKQWKDDALSQIEKHLAILRDGSKPFYIHCQVNLGGSRSEGSWARGNGWVMMTYAEILSVLDKEDSWYEKLSNDFRTLAKALSSYQTKNGLWRTIIDDDSAYEETSASAMYLFAYISGKKLGVFGNEYDTLIEQCSIGLTRHVDGESKFMGVSEGTWPGTIEYYKSLSQGEWWWGTGAYLLALSEIS